MKLRPLLHALRTLSRSAVHKSKELSLLSRDKDVTDLIFDTDFKYFVARMCVFERSVAE